MLLLVPVAAAGLMPPAEAVAPNYVPSGRLTQQLALTHMTGKVNPPAADAVALANRVDVILATKGSFAGRVTAMKQANPRLRILDYLNASFAQANQAPPFYPDSWYARDATGALVRSNNFGNYLMDISNADWVKNVVYRCKNFVATDGYDGCFLDMLGTAPIRGNYLTSQPINNATGRPWTDSEWLNATTALAQKVATRNRDLIVGGNGLAQGTVYFSATAPTSRLWPALNGAEAEVFVRGPSQGVTTYRSEGDWKADVDMLVDAGNRGESLFAVTKLWIAANRRPGEELAQVRPRHVPSGHERQVVLPFHRRLRRMTVSTADHPYRSRGRRRRDRRLYQGGGRRRLPAQLHEGHRARESDLVDLHRFSRRHV